MHVNLATGDFFLQPKRAYQLVTRLSFRSAYFTLEHFVVINQSVLVEVH